MSKQLRFSKCFSISLLIHGIVLVVLIGSFELSSKMPVVQNSDMKVVNAVVIDAPPSVMPAPPPPPEVKPKPQKIVKAPSPPQPKKIIKNLAQPKAIIEKQLLADIKKQTLKKKKIKHQELEQAFEKELKEQAAKSLQQQLLKEHSRLEKAQSQKTQGEVNKYKALILQAISQHWVVPMSIDKSLTCELLIRVAPGGMVLDVQIAKSSGDATLDHSARAAVFKASPLPVPTDVKAFEPFRQFVLKVKPENILRSDSWMS